MVYVRVVKSQSCKRVVWKTDLGLASSTCSFGVQDQREPRLALTREEGEAWVL